MCRKITSCTALVLFCLCVLSAVSPVLADDKTAVPAASPSPVAANGANVVVRVDAGGAGFVDAVAGRTWEADRPYAPAGTDGSTIGWGYLGPRWMQVIGASRPIAGTSASKVYQTQRQDATGYRFDVPNGQYRVTLRFAEMYVSAGPGTNVFDVFCQGQRVLGSVDVARNAGIYRAYDLTFSAKVTTNVLNIAFVPKVGAIAIAGLDVETEAAVGAVQTPGLTKSPVALPSAAVTTTVPVSATAIASTPQGTKLPSPSATLPAASPTASLTPTPLPVATATATRTATNTATSTPSFTATPIATLTATAAPAQATPSQTATVTPSPSATNVPATATALPSPVLLPTPTEAATPQAPQSEIGRLTQDTFTVTFHETDRQGAIDLLSALQTIKTRLAEETGLSAGVVYVQLFSTRDEYNQAMGVTVPSDQVGNIVDQEHIWLLAPKPDNPTESAEILRGVQDQVARLALNPIPNMPTWLRDGLASYEARSWNDAREQYLRSLVSMRRIASLRSLDGQTYNYLGGAITAHTVVDYMVQTYGPAMLPKLLSALQTQTFEQALRDSAGVAYADLDRAWLAYVTTTYGP